MIEASLSFTSSEHLFVHITRSNIGLEVVDSVHEICHAIAITGALAIGGDLIGDGIHGWGLGHAHWSHHSHWCGGLAHHHLFSRNRAILLYHLVHLFLVGESQIVGLGSKFFKDETIGLNAVIKFRAILNELVSKFLILWLIDFFSAFVSPDVKKVISEKFQLPL